MYLDICSSKPINQIIIDYEPTCAIWSYCGSDQIDKSSFSRQSFLISLNCKIICVELHIFHQNIVNIMKSCCKTMGLPLELTHQKNILHTKLSFSRDRIRIDRFATLHLRNTARSLSMALDAARWAIKRGLQVLHCVGESYRNSITQTPLASSASNTHANVG